MKTEVIKKLKIRLVIAILLVAIIAGFYGFNNETKITGNPIVQDGCTYTDPVYGGNILEIANPKNNSYVGKDALDITIRSNYYGTDISGECYGEPVENCSLEITPVLYIDENNLVNIPSFYAPKTNEGTKTYTNTTTCKNAACIDGNYTLIIKAEYTCVSNVINETTNLFALHQEMPILSQIYPTNNLQINLSSNTTAVIFPKLIATDSLGILNKTVSTESGIVSLKDQPNFNITLPAGVYTWNFTVTDIAGNKQTAIARFTVFNSTMNLTENETEIIPIENETEPNLNISFTSETTENNKLTNDSTILIEIATNTEVAEVNLTLQIFDETGSRIYQNTTTGKTLQIAHNFISDGTYYYNATLSYGETQTSTPTRKIIIDTEGPSIEIISPKTGQNTFTGSALIEFNAEDTNEVVKMWYNDGKKNTDYTKKINKTLEEGDYTWTIFAQDKAGNVAEQTIRFSIVAEKETNSTKKIAIFVIIIAIVLMILLVAYYFLRKKPDETSNTNNQNTNNLPPTGPSYGMPPQMRSQVQPVLSRSNLPPMQNQPTFKNNQFSR